MHFVDVSDIDVSVKCILVRMPCPSQMFGDTALQMRQSNQNMQWNNQLRTIQIAVAQHLST